MGQDNLGQLKIEAADKKSLRTGRKRKAWIIGVVVLFAGGLVVLNRVGILAPVTTVDVTTVSMVYPSQSLSVLNASGYIVAQRKAAVASKLTGRLEALLVEEGAVVKRGQILARMENEDSAATRAQARANLSNARAMLLQTTVDRDHFAKEDDRYKNLIARGYISPSEYDAVNTRYRRAQEAVKAAEAAVRAAEAALTAAEVHVDYALIRAPFDGVVLTKNADVGDIVTPLSASSVSKAAVVTLADMKSLQVEVDVSETSITLIQVGQPCDIHLDAIPDRRFRGAVHAIVPTVDRAKATVLVKVKFLDHDPRMLPDMSAKVSFLSRPLAGDEMKPRLAVHQSALESNRQESVVYRISGSTVRKTVVTTAGRLGDMVEVTAGLTAGDRVVLKPEGLKDGAKIKVAER